MKSNINKREILNSFTSYLSSTIDDLTESIDLIAPLNKQDYLDFKRLVDYMQTTLTLLQDSSNVRAVNELVDLELLFATWDEKVLPYFQETKYAQDKYKFFRDVDDIVEEIENFEINNEDE